MTRELCLSVSAGRTLGALPVRTRSLFRRTWRAQQIAAALLFIILLGAKSYAQNYGLHFPGVTKEFELRDYGPDFSGWGAPAATPAANAALAVADPRVRFNVLWDVNGGATLTGQPGANLTLLGGTGTVKIELRPLAPGVVAVVAVWQFDVSVQGKFGLSGTVLGSGMGYIADMFVLKQEMPGESFPIPHNPVNNTPVPPPPSTKPRLQFTSFVGIPNGPGEWVEIEVWGEYWVSSGWSGEVHAYKTTIRVWVPSNQLGTTCAE